MAFPRTFTVSLLLFSFLLLRFAEAHETISTSEMAAMTMSPAPAPQTIDCGGACALRCGLSKRPRLCKRACGSCCAKCKCVPPGTYGNLEYCPCYASLTTRRQVRKCP